MIIFVLGYVEFHFNVNDLIKKHLSDGLLGYYGQ